MARLLRRLGAEEDGPRNVRLRVHRPQDTQFDVMLEAPVPEKAVAQFMEPLYTRHTPPMLEGTFLDTSFDEGIAMAGDVVPHEENMEDMGIVKAVELATRYVCHRILRWILGPQMSQLAVKALSVYQLWFTDFALVCVGHNMAR